jgi:hypothetical protein
LRGWLIGQEARQPLRLVTSGPVDVDVAVVAGVRPDDVTAVDCGSDLGLDRDHLRGRFLGSAHRRGQQYHRYLRPDTLRAACNHLIEVVEDHEDFVEVHEQLLVRLQVAQARLDQQVLDVWIA